MISTGNAAWVADISRSSSRSSRATSTWSLLSKHSYRTGLLTPASAAMAAMVVPRYPS